MHRRDLLLAVGGALPILSGLSTDQLLTLGQAVHRRTGVRHSRLLALDAHQDETVATIAELILPETDTPGARAARVNEFIDLIVAEWYDDDERRGFLEGLAQIDARALRAIGRAFLDLSPAHQRQLLAELDEELALLRREGADTERHIFQQIKYLTLYGYYTSEIGLTQELHWAAIPGHFDPCMATSLGSRER